MKKIFMTIHHEGIFSSDPFQYNEGEVSECPNVDLGNCNYSTFLKKIKTCSKFSVKGLYYCGHKLDLMKNLKPLRNDEELARFIKTAFDNGFKVDLYVEHHGYDVIADYCTPCDDDEYLDDEDEEIEMEDISEYVGPENVGEEDVVIAHLGVQDGFLNKLVNGKYIRNEADGKLARKPTNVTPDDSEDTPVDDRFRVKEGVSYPVHDPNVPAKEMKPLLGMKFEHPEQLKECLISYGVANGYQLWYRRNDYRAVSVMCGRNVLEGRCSSMKGSLKGKEKVVVDDGSKDVDESSNKWTKSKVRDSRSPVKGSPKTTPVKGSPKATPNSDSSKKGCTFRLWASWMQGEPTFQIKTLIPDHTCARNFDLSPLVTYKWLAKQFATEVRKNPKISYRQMQEDVMEKFMIKVSLGQCRRAKQVAVYDYEGGLIDHYGKLWDYRHQLLTSNPGSTVELEVDTLDGGKTIFKRMYVCFKAMKDGWSKGCRRVIGLDGCFLKSTLRGQLLTAMGRDANNQMFPMAWAVVGVENNENWAWFVHHMSQDFKLAQGAHLTVISDGHKGLIEAVRDLLPQCEHRMCARHIYANFKKKWNGLHYKTLFWGAAYSTLEVWFNEKMQLIQNIDPQAYAWLMERDPKSWCRAFFQMGRSCAAFENGISESYHSAIGFARDKPIITMLESIRIYLMQRMVAMNEKATTLDDTICPSIRKHLEKLKWSQRYWAVIVSGFQEFEVTKDDHGYGVNLATKTCTCKWWDLSGIPCVHVVAAFCFINKDPVDGVSNWFKKEKWVKCYSYFIRPVSGSALWVRTNNLPPLPPKKRKMPGRPPKNRKKCVTEKENEISRTGRYMTCSNCWEKGHNKARCFNQTRPKPVFEKRKPGRKRKNTNQPYMPPDPAFHEPHPDDPQYTVNVDPVSENVEIGSASVDVASASVDPVSENVEIGSASVDPGSTSAATDNQVLPSVASLDPQSDPNTFTGLLQSIEQKVNAVAEMTAEEKRDKQNRKSEAERILDQAKKMGIFRKRGADGFRGPSQRIANQKRKNEDPNGPGKNPDTALDVSDSD